jgi:hypothetical protein
MDSKPTKETFLETLLPKINSEIPDDTTPAEAASILIGVERGVREAFANGRHADEEAQNLAPTPAHYTEIRAQDFTLVDAWGNARAGLHVVGNDAVLTLRDSQGRPRLRLRAGDNEAMITIYGERGEWGKGVLPATDEVERLGIGYNSDEDNPRIVIRDRNENECVSVEVFHGSPSDGTIRLFNPADDSYAIIDSNGLSVLDGDGNMLAEVAAQEDEASGPEKTVRDFMGQVTEHLVANADLEKLSRRLNRPAAAATAEQPSTCSAVVAGAGESAARAAREEAELAEDEALEAAEELAGAFATIREYWGYVPAGLHRLRLDELCNGAEFLNSVEWENDPESYRRVLFALLRSPEKEKA